MLGVLLLVGAHHTAKTHPCFSVLTWNGMESPPEPVICELIGTCAYANNSAGPWTSGANMRQMQLTDDAYNAMDFARFNHRNDTVVYMPGDREFNMAQHIQDMTNTYATYPDNRVSNHP